MSDENDGRVPVSGSCKRCGCALGFHASRLEGDWYCCGACAGSDRCTCGCKVEYRLTTPSDDYIPGRRMFSSRRADGLRTAPGGPKERKRAFPFADPRRGR